MGLIGYARVSTAEGRQAFDHLLDALNAAGCGCVFEDCASGAASNAVRMFHAATHLLFHSAAIQDAAPQLVSAAII